ncbi:restriction endonuclease subunit S [Peptostreptococcus porci]|uniref:restriction endonuclease subunit S n=1 Tax=Peptostreptococcus porci TaxID=2652282 RepID=UPI002A909D24|nr:restriction endonuclease subunit S [Peptostreptococcus porci]
MFSFILQLSKKINIRIPSIFDQKQIYKKLHLLDSSIYKKKSLLSLLDELIKSRFIELFGDPNNPYNVLWPIVPISKVTDCMVPGRDKPKSFTGTIPWITIDDLIVNNTTEKSKNNIGLTVDEIKAVKRKCIPSGSIIMSCVGNLGLCSISACELVINQQLHSFQCKSMVDNFYLMYYLSFLKGYMNKMATNTTVLYMNKTVCNSIPVILPPIELQHKFSKFLNKINKLKSDVQKSIDETQLLMDSLMQEYFG